MESAVDFHKSLMIKARIKEMQGKDPKRSFVSCWNELQRKEPALFEQASGLSPAGDQYGQLRQPKLGGYGDPYSRDSAGRTSYYGEPLKAGSDTPWLDLWAQIRGCQLVEAEVNQIGVSRGDIVQCSFAGTETIDSPKRTIVYLPAGTHQISARVNGKPETRVVHVDAKAAVRLQEALSERLRANVAPHAGFDHRHGPAAFLPKAFSWHPGRGILLEVDWTRAGREAVLGRNYGFFSPTFLLGPDGEIHGLPKYGEIGSLTNSPAFLEIEKLAAHYAYA